MQLRGKVTAVVGMRRAGKLMFLHQIQHERLQGGVARERMPYINFEDERLVGLTAEHLHPLVEEYYRRFPALRGHQRVIWCFDEIQAVPGWERFIRRLLDSEADFQKPRGWSRPTVTGCCGITWTWPCCATLWSGTG